jgi:hypothetical protein
VRTEEQLVQDNMKEMFSIIYTPTEGDAIQNYSRLFRRPEGCFLNVFDQDRIEDNLAQFGDEDDIDYIVVSDGEEVILIINSTLSLIVSDPRHWRPRRWRYSDLRSQTHTDDIMRGNTSFTNAPGSPGLWD